MIHWLELAEEIETAEELGKAKPQLEAIALEIEAINAKVDALSEQDQQKLAEAASADAELINRMVSEQVRIFKLENGSSMGGSIEGILDRLGQMPAELDPLPGSPSK